MISHRERLVDMGQRTLGIGANTPRAVDVRNNAGKYLRSRKVCATCGEPTNTMKPHWTCLRYKRGELVTRYTESEPS